MEESKSSNGGLIAVIILLVIALGATVYFGFINKEEKECPEKEEKKTTEVENTTEETKTECDNTSTCVGSKNSMHVYNRLVGDNGYNLYAYLENQGATSILIDYKNGLYYISENGQTSCAAALYENPKFTDKYDCSESDETSGDIYRFNINISDIENAYLVQSYRSDGADMAFVVFKSGKVNSYEFVDKGLVNKDIFKDIKVKEITNYSCAKATENGCEKEKISVVLQDGTTKDISLNFD